MRPLILATLLASYATLFVRIPTPGTGGAFEPLSARGREVERAIEEKRFDDALPIARDLGKAHPDDPTVAYWTAEVYRGLGRHAEESSAWERVLTLTQAADAACPALPMAYEAGGQTDAALDAYVRCATIGRDDAERWFDLGRAYAHAGRQQEADDAFAKSRALDASNPRLPDDPHAPVEPTARVTTSGQLSVAGDSE